MSIGKRRSARSGRAPLLSPGRPPVAGRDEQSRFWRAIAAGLSSEDAAVDAGVSQPVGTRWFRKAGGMPPASPSAKPLSGRYLSLLEREEIALLRVQGQSMQEIGRRLGRSASTISRELRRNAATRSGGLEYRATTAQWHAERSARRPKQTKLALNLTLRTYVEELLAGVVIAPSGVPVPGPAVPWKGRRHAPDRIGDGPGHGVRSRLRGACRSTSRMTKRCGSVTKPFIKRSSSKLEEPCAANWQPVCEPDGCCGCRGRAHVGEAGALSRRTS